MSPDMKEAIRKVAERVFRDPRRATWEDVDRLARGVLMLTGGSLPKPQMKRRA